MGTVMNVSDLVSQMQDTLATIHSTLQSLDPKVHDAKLDDLERKRDETIKALTTAFSAEADDLERKRKAEREEIIERRRKEDEERDRRRREEDENIAAKDHEEDEARGRKLREETEDVEQETDELMSRVEEEAREAATKGREKLQALQERRRELNRLIEEQLEMTLPTLPVAPTRRRSTRSMRTSTSPLPLADRKVPETPRTVNAPVHPEPEQQKAYGTDEEPQEAPAASSPADDVHKSDSSPLLQGKMDTCDQGTVEHIDYAPLQQRVESPTEPPEATEWPLAQERAVTNAVHDYRGDPQEPTAAPETDHHHLKSPSSQHSSINDVAAESHEVEIISDTINHGVDIPEMEEDEVPQRQVASNRISTGALSSTGRGSAEPLENAAPPNKEEHQDDHDHSPTGHLTGPAATNQDTSVAAEATRSPKHQLPGRHSELFMMATEPQPTPFYHHDLSDVEEASSTSSPREKHLDEDAYSHVSEASGPRPFSAHADPSGYVSDNGDAPDASFSHRGEIYIEENDISELERSHPDLPQVVGVGPWAVTNATESQGQGDTPADADFDENLPRLHPLQTPEITPEPSSAVTQKIDKERKETPEQEKNHVPEPGASQPNIPGQEPIVEATSYDNEPDQKHDKGGEPERGVHDALGIQESGHLDSGLGVTGPFQDDTLPLLSRGPPPGPDDDVHENDYDGPPVLKDSTASSRESPVDYMYKGYKRSSPEPYYIKPQTSEPGEREGESGGDGSHQSPSRRGHSDDDTDTESQRFVTPLPSQNSLRAYYQRENSPHDVTTDDYIGAHYYEEEDPQPYELEHQHSTTVHGEDNLFDDTDQSDALPADDEVETVTTSQPGTPVLPEHSEQTEEMQVDRSTEARMIPEVTVESPTSPKSPARKSWIEEVDSYFEEEELVSQPQTPPPQTRGWAQDQGSSNPGQEEMQQKSPVSTGSGLSASHHNIERPQTPTRHESLASSEEATPEESTTRVRDATDTRYHMDDGWTPQSIRTRTPFSSPPGSPLHRVSSHKPEPPMSRNLPTESPALHQQRYDSYEAFDDAESKNPVSLTTPWQERESPDLSFDPQLQTTNRHSTTSEGCATNTGSGSLFKRMRSIFEPGRSGPNQPPNSTQPHPRHHYRDSYPSPSHTYTHTHTHTHPARSPSMGTWPTQHQPPTISNTPTTTNTTSETVAAGAFPFPPRGARFSPTRTRFSPLPSPTRPTALPPDPGPGRN